MMPYREQAPGMCKCSQQNVCQLKLSMHNKQQTTNNFDSYGPQRPIESKVIGLKQVNGLN